MPAIAAGRPFVYWDTPTFYGWGHDVVAALRQPWPPLSALPVHRGLWASDNYAGAWQKISATQFQLVLSAIGARSVFYAVPLFLLGSQLTLWAPVALQALIAAWLLRVATRAAVPNAPPVFALVLAAGLAAASTAPFFVAFLMPDIFAAFALLTTCLLIAYHGRLGRADTVGCATLLAFSVLAHLSVLPTVLALLFAGLIVLRLLSPAPWHWRGGAIVAVALACAAAVSIGSGIGLASAFGQRVRPPPFLEGRVIVDGPGQQFLRETCARRHWAACLWKNSRLWNTDDIIWPDVTWHHLPLITDPAERQRFLDQQPAIVIGTVLDHPLEQAVASAANAGRQLLRFTIAGDVGGSLSGLLNAGTDRTERIIQIEPDIKPCLVDHARACDDRHTFRYLQLLQCAVVIASLLFLCLRGALWLRAPSTLRRQQPGAELMVFCLILAVGVVLNGIVCGATSGPWGRYQARVVWLVPLAAMLLAEHLRQTRAALPAQAPGRPPWPQLGNSMRET